jgi:DNA repair exonuclease SbcCD ATPase subunit
MEYEQLRNLTDLQIIKEQLLTYKLKQDALEQELKQLELNKLQILESVDRLEGFRPLLKQALNRAKDFKQLIDDSWGPLTESCTRIVALDSEQESIEKCIGILQDIDDLKECYVSTEHAISSNNLQLACEWIHKSLDYDVDLISRIYSETQVLDNPADNDYGLMGPSPVGRLAELHQKLTEMVISAFDNALTGNEPNELVRIFKLFPAIGRGLFIN